MKYPAITREQLRLWYDGYATKEERECTTEVSGNQLFPIIILEITGRVQVRMMRFFTISRIM